MIATVRICQHCGATLPPMALCDGEALPEEALAQIVMERAEFVGDDGRKQRLVIPRACLERYRDTDGRVRFPEIVA